MHVAVLPFLSFAVYVTSVIPPEKRSPGPLPYRVGLEQNSKILRKCAGK